MAHSVYFEVVRRKEDLLVCNDVILWHLAHGGVYNCYRVVDGMIAAELDCIYLTLLCGSGAIIHIAPAEHILSRQDIAGVIYKIRSFVAPAFPVLYATIPHGKAALSHLARRAGFVPIPDGGSEEFQLLKFVSV